MILVFRTDNFPDADHYVELIRNLVSEYESEFTDYRLKFFFSLMEQNSRVEFVSDKILFFHIGVGIPRTRNDILFSIYHEFKHGIDYARGLLTVSESCLYFQGKLSLDSPVRRQMMFDSMKIKYGNPIRALEEYHRQIYTQLPHELSANVFAVSRVVNPPDNRLLKISYETAKEIA